MRKYQIPMICMFVAHFQCGAFAKTSNLVESGIEKSSNVQPIYQSADAPTTGVIVDSLPRTKGFSLTLAGGGARGAAHIGVLKVLEVEGIKPNFIAGSSIGAMIGGLYAAGVSASKIERLALSGELKKAYFPSNRKLQTITYFGPYFLARGFLIHPKIGLFSGRALSKFVSKHPPDGVADFAQTRIPFACAAVDLTTTKEIWLSKGNLGDAIRASNSAPGFLDQ